MKTIEVEVINRLGLHARPAAKLTQKANEFLSEIKIDKDGRVVNGKSIMGVMLLAASKGTVLKISADGTDYLRHQNTPGTGAFRISGKDGQTNQSELLLSRKPRRKAGFSQFRRFLIY